MRFIATTMVDLVNNVVALRINSRDRTNISDSTTDFKIALQKSLRNIAAVNVAGVVIPRNDTLIGPNNDTLTGEIHIDNIINPFSVSIVRTNYTAASLATELQTELNANTDMLSYGITFAVSYVTLSNRMNIVATYPLGVTKTWEIVIDYTSLRDVIGIGAPGTTSQTFTAPAGSTTLAITCPRAPSLVRALTYNITSNILTNGINTSYIASLGKQFQITGSNGTLVIDSQFVGADTSIDIQSPGILPEIFSNMMIGTSVSLSNTGTVMAVGSSKYGVYIFTRATTGDAWILDGAGPLRLNAFLYSDQGKYVALSGDGSIVAFSSFDQTHVYSRSGDTWLFQYSIVLAETRLSFNIDGSTLALSTLTGSGSVAIYLGSGLQQTLTNPPGSVKFGSSGVSLSNTGDHLITGDAQFGSAVAYVYLRTGTSWALQQTIVPATAVGGFIDAVAFSGNGLYFAISSSTDSAGTGATWIYNWTGVTWLEQQKIAVASTSIALNIAGDTLVIGASAGNGKVSVYKRSGILWTSELLNYVGTGGGASNQGASVAITGAGDDIIWSGPADSGLYGNNQGAVWSSHRITATWAQTLGKITSYIGVVQPRFGRALAMSDDGQTMAAGFPDVDSLSGIAYVFVSRGLSWELQATFNPRPGSNARIGENVALSADGNTLVLSGRSDIAPGGVWVYVRTGTTWTLQANLISTVSPMLEQGSRIALNGPGNTLVVTGSQDGILIWKRLMTTWSEQETNLGVGMFGGAKISRVDISNDETKIVASSTSLGAFVFSLANGTWSQVGANFASFYTPVVSNSQFGTYCCIAADGNTIAVSDPNDNANNGVVFIFKYIAGSWIQNASLTGTDPSPPSNQGFAIHLTNSGNTCVFTTPTFSQPFVNQSGASWVFNYNGVSWSQSSFSTTLGYDYGSSISGQRTGATYVIGVPNITSPGGRLVGKVMVYYAAGTQYSLTSQVVVPAGSYSIFDLVNTLNSLLATAIPTEFFSSTNGFSVSFDGTRLAMVPAINFPLTSIMFRISPTSSFTIARWPSQEYKISQISNPVVFSINNDVIKSITSHSDNSDNVLVDNTPDAPYRKYPAGYTIDAGTPIDIQLRNDRDQIIDLNGSDWVMTVYATVRS